MGPPVSSSRPVFLSSCFLPSLGRCVQQPRPDSAGIPGGVPLSLGKGSGCGDTKEQLRAGGAAASGPHRRLASRERPEPVTRAYAPVWPCSARPRGGSTPWGPQPPFPERTAGQARSGRAQAVVLAAEGMGGRWDRRPPGRGPRSDRPAVLFPYRGLTKGTMGPCRGFDHFTVLSPGSGLLSNR